MSKLTSLTVQGFRSIKSLENFALGDVTVLIGANGAGKSNFVELFRMLRSMADGAFQNYAQFAGPEMLFWGGPRTTSVIHIRIDLSGLEYEFWLGAKPGGGLFVKEERILELANPNKSISSAVGTPEAGLYRMRDIARDSFGESEGGELPSRIYEAVSSWTVYHVHDTSPLSPMRGWYSVSHNQRLATDARNLAPLLMHLQTQSPAEYARIRDTIRLCAPYFDDFHFQPQRRGPEEQVSLHWIQRGSQEPFQPTILSDGTLRFIALVTALLQPNPPSTIVIDEPELGLHPLAIALLAEAIRAVTTRTQVIVATQSPLLLDRFQPDEVVVVERENGSSVFRRPDPAALADWLTDYSLGQIWLSNLMGGRPALD